MVLSAYCQAVRSMQERGYRVLDAHTFKGRVVFTGLFALGLISLSRITKGIR